MIVPDEISDECANKARELWASLRETGFHNGRNRIAALLRASLAAAQAELVKFREFNNYNATFERAEKAEAEIAALTVERDDLYKLKERAFLVARDADSAQKAAFEMLGRLKDKTNVLSASLDKAPSPTARRER